jgi:hypothetical protein
MASIPIVHILQNACPRSIAKINLTVINRGYSFPRVTQHSVSDSAQSADDFSLKDEEQPPRQIVPKNRVSKNALLPAILPAG